MKTIKKGRPKTFNKHNAENIAMHAYWREGMDNISLNEICRKIGESKPSVYREYGGEEGLKASALKLYLDKRVNVLSEYLFGDKPFIENLGSALNFLVNSHFDDNNSYPCLYNKESWFPSKTMSAECKSIIYDKDKEILFHEKVVYDKSFSGVKIGDPIIYVNDILNMGIAINQGDMADKFVVSTIPSPSQSSEDPGRNSTEEIQLPSEEPQSNRKTIGPVSS